MKLERILVPIDFSESARRALEFAASMARSFDARLVVLHVVEPIPYSAPFGVGGMPDASAAQASFDVEAIARKEIDSFLEDAPDIGCPLERRVLVGHPADQIVHFAESQSIDLIVMGTHGRRGLARLLLGSVAGDVIRRAPCPVTTVRAPSRHSTPPKRE